MNVLLIYPEFPDTFWSFKYALKFIRKKATSPPLGLLTIAAMLPRDWNLRLVDLNVSRMYDEDLTWADYAFISAMVVQRQATQVAIQRCKNAGIRVVAGGPLFTSEYEQFPDVDHFILNEGELTLPPFLDDLAHGRARRVYQTTEYADIQKTPVPRWDLADLKRYATLNVQYSRGCPYNCDFCNVTALLGHRPRIKSSQQIIDELNSLFQLGWRETVFFVDDNLIGNKRMLKTDLLPALIQWQIETNLQIPFSTEASINLADDEELMEMMAQAGFNSVFIGIETPDEESLEECSKKQNRNRDLVADVKNIQQHGLQVQGGFIVGFDSDTPSIFQRQIDFIQKSGIVSAMVGLLQAPPGTRLYERLKEEGRLLELMSGNNVDGTTNIIPKMNLDTLKEGYREILSSIYSPEIYYQRVITFLKEYKLPPVKSPIKFEHVLAFMRSMVRLGVIGKERMHYWKLLAWTLFRRTELFPLAVTLAIYGHHFRKVCELNNLMKPVTTTRGG
jgi:radical SAM superfamily enzyme YgiQ (UPF0313 family)